MSIEILLQGMSADTLIGNLLDKKDTFTPKPGAVGKQTADRAEAGGHMSQVLMSTYGT